MRSEDIPAVSWGRYLQHFSRVHAFAPIKLEVHDPERGPAVAVSKGVFREVTLDAPGGHPKTIVVSVGDSVGGHLNHFIQHPRAVRLQTAENGVDRSLLVEADDGTYTIVRFQRPVEVAPGNE